MTENRKFSLKKLYKLIKILVIITSVLGLLWFGMLIYNEKSFDQGNQESFNKCMRISKEGGSYDGQCMQSKAEAKNQFNDSMNYALILGILVPVIFFSSVSLGKYLFPIKGAMGK